jgi:hypothetical protein
MKMRKPGEFLVLPTPDFRVEEAKPIEVDTN